MRYKQNGIGYLLDNDSDGVYDAFYSDVLQQTLSIQKEDDSYPIDSDGDGDWDYTYTATNGFAAYKEPTRTYGFEIISRTHCYCIISVLETKAEERKVTVFSHVIHSNDPD